MQSTKRSVILLAVISSMLMSGCASITGTTGQSISVQSKNKFGAEVNGAMCELTNNKGTWFITTPGSTSIHRSNDDLQILCKKQGEDNGRVAVVSATKGSMFGNILLGGGIGAIVDHNNGSAYEYPTLIQVVMGSFSKIEPPNSELQSNTNPIPSANLSRESASLTKEQKLKELKKMHDEGLLTEDIFIERQRKNTNSWLFKY